MNDLESASIARVQQRTALALFGVGAVTVVTEALVPSAPPPWNLAIIGLGGGVIPPFAMVWWLSRRGKLGAAGWMLMGTVFLAIVLAGIVGTQGSALAVTMAGTALLLTMPENALPSDARSVPWAWVATVAYIVSILTRQGLRQDLSFQSHDDFYWVLLVPPVCYLLMRMMMRRMVADIERAWQRSEAANEKLTRSQLKLEFAVDEARQANLAKSQFLANMSHELRTPLTSVIGYAELLQEEQQGTPELEVIREAGAHLLELISDVLDLSKIEAGHMAPQIEAFDTAALCQELITLMQPQFDAGANALETRLPPHTVRTDRLRLRQILMNLLSNASKFTSNGVIRLRILPGDAFTTFEVEDTGFGIDAEDLERILRPFERVNHDHTIGGTGLGLALCVRLSAMLHGTLEVESELGKGTCFRVRIATTLDPSYTNP